MQIKVLFFASYRELLGRSELQLELGAPARVSDLLEELRRRGTPYSLLPAAPVVAVDREFVSLETRLQGGEEVALVPPVAGG